MQIWDDDGIRVAWSASLQAWDVRFVAPRKASLVIPQLCPVDRSCHTRVPDGIFSCSELRFEMQNGNWQNENIAFAHDDCLQALSPMPATDKAWQTAVSLYSSFHDVHVVWPLAVRIYHHNNSIFLTKFVDSQHSTLKMRVLYITRFVTSPVVAVHVQSFTVPMRLPQNNLLSLSVQHECARRGLKAPLLSTMELFVNAYRDEVCIWDCRHDCFRVPWNSAPPLRSNLNFSLQPLNKALPHSQNNISLNANITIANYSQITQNNTKNTKYSITSPLQEPLRVCQALPSAFLAVEFDFVLQVDGVTLPTLLDDLFLEQLDAAADKMSAEATKANKKETTILLTVAQSAYNYIKFDNFILRAISFRRNTDRYSVADNSLYVPQESTTNLQQPQPSSESGPTRRLLQQTPGTSLVVQGLCVISSTSMSAQIVERNLRSTLLSVPVSVFYNNARDKYGLQIIRIHTMKAETHTPSPSPSAEVIHSVTSSSAVWLITIAVVTACCCLSVLLPHNINDSNSP